MSSDSLSRKGVYIRIHGIANNMRAQQRDTSAEIFAKQLLGIGNGKIAVDESTHFVALPSISTFTAIKDKWLHNNFSNFA